ncbi:hypothetical protein AB0L65_53745 [Nonomuraea sp. NPDC052116]|uniref:hypothetical protein n=1 Tax=Nonomuraea sp. NPDC052116 TaxID=3155665 RepID=UPI003443365E
MGGPRHRTLLGLPGVPAQAVLGVGGALGSGVAGVAGERLGASAPFLAASGLALAGATLAPVLLRRDGTR